MYCRIFFLRGGGGGGGISARTFVGLKQLCSFKLKRPTFLHYQAILFMHSVLPNTSSFCALESTSGIYLSLDFNEVFKIYYMPQRTEKCKVENHS